MDENGRITWRTDELVIEGVRLHYARGGEGSPVLLLHGLTDAGTSWEHVAGVLARSHQVVVLDQRGHGQSSAPDVGYAIADFVGDAAAVISALELIPAAVMGHSLGGLVALYLAAAHPYLVSRLVMEDPPLPGDWINQPGSAEEVDAARQAWFASALEVRNMSPEERLQHIQERSPGWKAEEHSAWVESKLTMSPRLWKSEGVDLRGDWRAALRRIQCPVLLIHGDVERGSLVNEARAQEVRTLVGDAQSIHIPGASHAVHRDLPAEFMSAILPFLERGATTTHS